MKVYVDKDKLESHDIQPTTDLGGKEFHQVRMWFNKDTDNVEIVSLADYTKQVRKEVVKEIKDKAYQDSEFYDLENGGISERNTYLINEHILDQIQDNI